MSRRVIAIAVAATETEEQPRNEALYALDSDGVIWQWCDGDHAYTSGWIEMAAPWDRRREKRKKLETSP